MQIFLKKCFIRALAFTLLSLISLSAGSAETAKPIPDFIDAPTAQQTLPPLTQTKPPAVVNPILHQSLVVSAIDPIITGPVPVKK
ncbi:hypothetical protein ACI0FM_00885 [Paenochrobactrum sp. BZR 588]|uniref:hypothetical protein n=1 Tax=Paenochrobactrum TaxID=999488 RepID=UPI0035BC0E29